VAGSNALDQYYMRHPAEFFNRNSEEAVLNVSNPYIQASHVLCAAKEFPLTEKDEKYFGTGLTDIVGQFETDGVITGGKCNLYITPHMNVSIRSIDRDAYSIYSLNGRQYTLIEKDLEAAVVFKEAFNGAVYLHKGTPYLIKKIDHIKKEIHAIERTNIEYYTKPLLTLETVSFWIELPRSFSDLLYRHDFDFAGGIHAIEHAIIAMYPLCMLADRNDMGGVSTSSHNDLNENPGIFIYDGHHGGVGYAKRGYEIITAILTVTLKAVQSCTCTNGCPGCIQSPKCTSHNKTLDKHAAIMILNEILGL
jgi:DEAD/DEAH box helicase domain-containing protein